ncbi:MAG: AAA family ATPase [Elusimicrobiota bacterium]
MEYQDLLEQNPWWEAAQGIEKDEKIKIFEASTLKWYSPTYKEFDFSHSEIYTIRGPRQVGKTTLLKLLIKKLLKEGISPQAIFYYTLDLIHTN